MARPACGRTGSEPVVAPVMPPALQAGQPDLGGPPGLSICRGPIAAPLPGPPGHGQPADPLSGASAARPTQTAGSVPRSKQPGWVLQRSDSRPCLPPVTPPSREGDPRPRQPGHTINGKAVRVREPLGAS